MLLKFLKDSKLYDFSENEYKDIAENFKDLGNYHYANWEFTDRLGQNLADRFLDRLEDFLIFWNEHQISAVDILSDINTKWIGKTIIFSGIRDEYLEQQLKNSGAAVVKSMSKKVTLCIYTNTSTNKYKKSREYNIKCIEYSDFIKKFNKKN